MKGKRRRLLQMNNASGLSKGTQAPSAMSASNGRVTSVKRGWENTAVFGSKGHILHVVGSLYGSFVSRGNPVSSPSVTRSCRQFYSYLLGQRQRGLHMGPRLPWEM